MPLVSPEYLALEALLTLFARLLPPIASKSESGRLKRERFVREVSSAMSDQGIAFAGDIIDALNFAPSTPWEETSVKIIELLSKNVSLYADPASIYTTGIEPHCFQSPQPFRVNSITVGSTTFPQPLPEDRLYLDQKSFFANVDQVFFSVINRQEGSNSHHLTGKCIRDLPGFVLPCQRNQNINPYGFSSTKTGNGHRISVFHPVGWQFARILFR